MSVLELYHKGGVMMVFITLLSIYVLGVVFYKLWQFKCASVLKLGYVPAVMALFHAGKTDEMRALLAAHKGPIADTLLACQKMKEDGATKDACETEVMRLGSQTMVLLEKHMRGLEMASSIAPLLGLLGTVVGLIDSFSKLGSSGTRVDPSVLAGGIWEALLTTAAGLAVAIIAFAAHYAFDSLIERVRHLLQDAATQLVHGTHTKSQGVDGTVTVLTPKYVRS